MGDLNVADIDLCAVARHFGLGKSVQGDEWPTTLVVADVGQVDRVASVPVSRDSDIFPVAIFCARNQKGV